jgi:hypothetical protein
MDNVTAGLKEIVWEFVNWIHVTQDIGINGGSSEHLNKTFGFHERG